MADESYALNEDGTAKDPKAFQQALRNDAEKMKALEEEPETLKIVMGDDIHGFQELIKGVYQVLQNNEVVNLLDVHCLKLTDVT